jgi:hypothetical protein
MLRKLRAWSRPEGRLERAIAAAELQHRQLQEQAAGLHEERRSVEVRRTEVAALLHDLAAETEAAGRAAAAAAAAGDEVRASEQRAAEASFALQLAAAQRELEELDAEAARAVQASEDAAAAIDEQAAVLEGHLDAERRLGVPLDDDEGAT